MNYPSSDINCSQHEIIHFVCIYISTHYQVPKSFLLPATGLCLYFLNQVSTNNKPGLWQFFSEALKEKIIAHWQRNCELKCRMYNPDSKILCTTSIKTECGHLWVILTYTQPKKSTKDRVFEFFTSLASLASVNIYANFKFIVNNRSPLSWKGQR